MFELPVLPYSFDALEPYIDAKTMEVHYSKHHQTYLNNLNDVLSKHSEIKAESIEYILKNLNAMPEDIRTPLRNNGGGYYNHNLYWSLLTPNSSKEPTGTLNGAIIKTFGNFNTFKETFTKAALGRFGSGWAWLVMLPNRNLEIYSTSNQDTPISENKLPLLTLDVWEHAYYLKYQNKRAEYIENWWNVINWSKAEELYIQDIS